MENKLIIEEEFFNFVKKENLNKLNPLSSDSDGNWDSNKIYFNDKSNITVAYSETIDFGGNQKYVIL